MKYLVLYLLIGLVMGRVHWIWSIKHHFREYSMSPFEGGTEIVLSLLTIPLWSVTMLIGFFFTEPWKNSPKSHKPGIIKRIIDRDLVKFGFIEENDRRTKY